MQFPSTATVVIGLLLGMVASFYALKNSFWLFSAASCPSGKETDGCQSVNLDKAVGPSLLTVGVCFALVWAAPNLWNMASGFASNDDYN